jgi:hypothetical protein
MRVLGLSIITDPVSARRVAPDSLEEILAWRRGGTEADRDRARRAGADVSDRSLT